ncbi:MAG: hypothetical protein AAF677_10145, partial [Pseudomonadota bacterium]
VAAALAAIAPAAGAEDPASGPHPAAAPAAPAAIVAFTVRDGRRIEESLTGRPGDAASGLRLYADAARTGCIACHGVPEAPGLRSPLGSVPDPARAPRAGVPPLERVGARLDAETIRLWLVAPGFLTAPGRQKPSVYAVGQRRVPDDPLYAGPRLTAAEVEDMVAWLAGLTGEE